MFLNEINQACKIIIVHNGALGDFLLAWPTIWNIKQNFSRTKVFWAGREIYLPWIEKMGINRADPMTRKAVQSLYSAPSWPDTFKDTLIFWFGLKQRIIKIIHPNLIFLTGIDLNRKNHVREVYARKLKSLGLIWDDNWLFAWQNLYLPTLKPESIIIFPGSGHPAKNWPLHSFFMLAKNLQKDKENIRFVLGPVEVERKLTINDFPVVTPQDFNQLLDILARAKMVIGNDSGPLHLAGYMGIPGISLFGPTSPKQWAPQGMHILTSPKGCAPCSDLGKISCPAPECMAEIKVRSVLATARKILGKLGERDVENLERLAAAPFQKT
ncbi:glycosyltransferase family 9 protein [Desulfohalobiaceae bacterium Ax17]|uniref:glycosyltransferase family 9 protein n=1 Tax=Desulfovulcanus ferrireducens TaxID=2831190 RepID=UPI00207B9C57|nr:glycosyltransferase family 9 protein [Desulfovulcanus ferrireducens]MBT8762490.1 glycosyltransferase family 9 protein [Desulfovulcanus ferrireducens]